MTTDMQNVVDLLQQAIAILTTGTTSNREEYEPVFDVQPHGYSKIGGVEKFRDELKADGSPLALRFEKTLPQWWFVQDQEDYVELTPEQNRLQEFNCGNARFSLAIGSGGVAGDGLGRSLLWRLFYPAVVRDVGPNGFFDTPLVHAGSNGAVYAVANDARDWTGKITAVNPRVKDMYDVVKSAYQYFYERNKDATHDVNEVYVKS